MAVKTGNPETDATFALLSIAIREGFDIPNDICPRDLIDKRTERNNEPNLRRTSLAFALRKSNEKHEPKVSQHELDKAAKAERIANYGKQWDANPDVSETPAGTEGGFDYDVDEMRLHTMQTAFCKAALSSPMMSPEDFEDDEI